MSVREHIELIRFYANAGIGGAVAINSAALLALLSQLGEAPPAYLEAFKAGLSMWASGVAAGTLAWFFAYLSVVAFAHQEARAEKLWVSVATFLFFGSVVCFVGGCWNMADSLP